MRKIYFMLTKDIQSEDTAVIVFNVMREDFIETIHKYTRIPIVGLYAGQLYPLKIKKRDMRIFNATVKPYLETEDWGDMGKWFALKVVWDE